MTQKREISSRDEHAAILFFALGNPVRIALLKGFSRGEKAGNVAEKIGKTRGGIREHLDKLENGGLIRRIESQRDFFVITPIGKEIVGKIDGIGEKMERIDVILDKKEEEARAEFKLIDKYTGEKGFGISLNAGDSEKAIKAVAWKRAEKEIEVILEEGLL